MKWYRNSYKIFYFLTVNFLLLKRSEESEAYALASPADTEIVPAKKANVLSDKIKK